MLQLRFLFETFLSISVKRELLRDDYSHYRPLAMFICQNIHLNNRTWFVKPSWIWKTTRFSKFCQSLRDTKYTREGWKILYPVEHPVHCQVFYNFDLKVPLFVIIIATLFHYWRELCNSSLQHLLHTNFSSNAKFDWTYKQCNSRCIQFNILKSVPYLGSIFLKKDSKQFFFFHRVICLIYWCFMWIHIMYNRVYNWLKESTFIVDTKFKSWEY